LHRLEGLEAVRRAVEAARNEAKICSLDWKLLATKEPPPRQWATPVGSDLDTSR
jgi:hypothetical protein